MDHFQIGSDPRYLDMDQAAALADAAAVAALPAAAGCAVLPLPAAAAAALALSFGKGWQKCPSPLSKSLRVGARSHECKRRHRGLDVAY